MACDWGGHAGECFPGDELAGRRVVVTLSLEPVVEVTGVLVERTCDGEVTVDTDKGRRFCWPLLRIRPVVGSAP